MIKRGILYYLIVGCFILIVSCIPQDKQVPDVYIQPDKMKLLLYDMYLADAYNSERLVRDRTLNHQTETVSYYRRILKNHGISNQQFFKSLHYYKIHPELYSVLTDSLEQYAQRKIGKPLRDELTEKKHGNNLKDTARPTRN